MPTLFLKITNFVRSRLIVALSRLGDYGAKIATHAEVSYRLFRGFLSLEGLNLLIHSAYSPEIIRGGLARSVLKSVC